jgi:hypothetical protein
MKQKCLSAWIVIAAASAVTACTQNSPTRPTDTAASPEASSVLDAKSGVTLTTPQLVSPVASQKLKFTEQPITLTVRNGATTGSTPLTYTFQVASDAGFAAIVYSRDGVAQGSGQTALTIDKLAGNKDYYWRSRVSAGSAAGLFSAPRTFNVGPEVILQAPQIVAPANGGNLSSQALLTVNNVARTGPAGPLTYRFEISDSSSFGNLAFVAASVSEQPSGQTSARMDANLTTNATYYLRVRASDNSNSITGPYSSVISFRYVPFDMRQATIQNSPPDLGFWPETAKVTLVNFDPSAIVVDFDKRDSPDRWPDESFGSGSIQYTLGMCVYINGHWFCSAVVQFWYGRELTAGGVPDQVSYNWFYDPARWGPMTGYQPSDGETVGMFVGAGNLRGRTDPGYVNCPRVCERSNVAMVPWNIGAYYAFQAGKILTTRR